MHLAQHFGGRVHARPVLLPRRAAGAAQLREVGDLHDPADAHLREWAG